MVRKSKPDSSISPEFWAAVRRWRDRYDAKVGDDRRAELNKALARFEDAVDDYNSASAALNTAAGTTSEAAEQMIRARMAGLSDAAFFKWRLMDEPRPAIAESLAAPLRFRLYAAERKMWQALFDAVKIDITVLARTDTRTDIVDMVKAYQTMGNALFFKGLGAAVAQQGDRSLHRSQAIDKALYALAGREVGYTYPKIAKLIDQRLHRHDTNPEAVRELVRRHRRRLETGVKA